eukprot:3801361-Amphidinium_carterae.2
MAELDKGTQVDLLVYQRVVAVAKGKVMDLRQLETDWGKVSNLVWEWTYRDPQQDPVAQSELPAV